MFDKLVLEHWSCWGCQGVMILIVFFHVHVYISPSPSLSASVVSLSRNDINFSIGTVPLMAQMKQLQFWKLFIGNKYLIIVYSEEIVLKEGRCHTTMTKQLMRIGVENMSEMNIPWSSKYCCTENSLKQYNKTTSMHTFIYYTTAKIVKIHVYSILRFP